MKTVTMYLHGDKEYSYSVGEDLGLSEEALANFQYALYEVEFEIEVDEQTGEYKILSTKET